MQTILFITDAIQSFSDENIHEDPVMKCYMSCLFQVFKLTDDRGEIDFNKIQSHVDKMDEEFRTIVDPMVKSCQNPIGDDQCKRAFSIHKCWKQTDCVHYFLA